METIQIAEPLDDAPQRFHQLCVSIRSALGLDVSIEHIGSTAVPSLAAKPIIDAMVARPPGYSSADITIGMERCGFWHWYADPHRNARLMFSLWTLDGEDVRRHANIHIVSSGSDFWRDQIEFRNALRANPVLAQEYAALKRRLALAHPHDIEAYTAGKTEFIVSVIQFRDKN